MVFSQSRKFAFSNSGMQTCLYTETQNQDATVMRFNK